MKSEGIETALARARGFAASAPAVDPLERARLALLLGDAPRAALVSALPEPSTPAAALRTLALLAEVRALGATAADPAVRALEAAQRDDGAFAAEDADEQCALVVTGIAAALLARSPFSRTEPLRGAGAWLTARWGPERVQDGDFGRLAGYTSWLASANPELADAGLQWCGREWERGFRSGRLDAGQAARVLLLADAPVLPGARVRPEEITIALLARQAPDGGWPAADVAARVAATAEALAALRHLGRWS